MKLHHLNCISMRPPGGRLFDGRSSLLERATLVCHCVLVEAPNALVLIDTGFGLHDVSAPHTRLSEVFLRQMRPELREAMTAARQIEALGFSRGDVRHVVLTHLDFDHAGGLDDFPNATVHLLEAERDSAAAQTTTLDRHRYRPAQWSTRERWRTYRAGEGEDWHGFEAVRELEGLPPELLMISLVGHTLGHAGVAIETEGGWVLHAGDAYFFHGEMDPARYRCPSGLRLYQRMMEKDRPLRLENQRRLRELVRRGGANMTVFCAHDASEFEQRAGRPAEQPVVAGEALTRR